MSAHAAVMCRPRQCSLAVLLAGAVSVAGCGTADDGATRPADAANARATIRAADSAFAAAAAARDLDGSVGSLSADAIMFPPDQPPLVGRAAIREYMRESFATPGFSVSWTTDTVVVSASGDMAYSFARSRYTFPGHSGTPGSVDTAHGKGVSIWRRDPDGRWRTVADIWNGSPTLPPIRPIAATQ
jgi:ketosteroid isomerase-like protein